MDAAFQLATCKLGKANDTWKTKTGHKHICDLWPWYGRNHGHRFDVDSSSEPSLHFAHGAQKHSTKSPINVQSQHWHRGFGVACFVGSNPVNMFSATAVLIPLVVCWFPGKIQGWKKKGEKGMQPKTQLVATKCFEDLLYMLWLSQTRDEWMKWSGSFSANCSPDSCL